MLTGIAFDIEHTATIAELGESHSRAFAASTTRTADTVGIVFGLHGQAVVEDVSDRGHIQATGSHIGRHQNLDLTIAQRHQAAVTQTLAQRAVQSNSGEAVLLQIVGQTVAFHLSGSKHNGLVDAAVTQPVVQHLALVLSVVGPEQHLLDVLVLLLSGRNRDLLHVGTVVVHHTHGQLLNAGSKRSAEHHGLLALCSHLVDFSQIVGKAQVQHAVSFVNHQELHLVQLDLHGALQVQQTARRCYHQVSVLQLGDLQLVGHAAHDVGNADAAAVLDQLDGVMGHLLSQFTCGAQHQRARHSSLEVASVGGVLALGALGSRLAAGCSFSALAVKLGLGSSVSLGTLTDQRVQHGQQEGCGLAGTSLAGHHQVHEGVCTTAVHGQRNSLLLHACGLGVAQVGHSLHQFRGQTQFYEAIGFVGNHFFSGGILCVHLGQHGVQAGIDFRRRQRNIGSGHLALLQGVFNHE